MALTKLKIIFFLFLGIPILYGQEYHSDLEKTVFESTDINPDLLEGMFAIDLGSTIETVTTFKQSVSLFLKDFPPKEKEMNKEIDRINGLLNKIHSSFLGSYNRNSFFPDIKNNGTYNCVTATALYAYIFDQLEVPYEVISNPEHVYLTIYPDTYDIYIESTVSGENALPIPNTTKIKEVVDDMISLKIVEKEAVDKQGYEAFYKDYFFKTTKISKEALIGMQYYNKGVQEMLKFNNDAGLKSFKKSKQFYSSPLMDTYLKIFTLEKLLLCSFKTDEDIQVVIDAINSGELETKDPSRIIDILYEVTQNNPTRFVEEQLKNFEKVEDSHIQLNIKVFLLSYLAENEQKKQNEGKAIEFSKRLLHLDKNNPVAKTVISFYIYKKAYESPKNEETYLTFMSQCKKYPFLKTIEPYPLLITDMLSIISYDYYNKKNEQKGEQYQLLLEEFLDSYVPLGTINNTKISNLYYKAGNYYYYHKEDYKKALLLYTKGLEFTPEDSDLKEKIQWCKEALE